jgi:hypothetical protein
LTGVRNGAVVAIGAGGVVGFGRVRTLTSGDVADSREVALVESLTLDGNATALSIEMTAIVVRARVAVVARSTKVLERVVAESSFAVAGSAFIALAGSSAGHSFSGNACTSRAGCSNSAVVIIEDAASAVWRDRVRAGTSLGIADSSVMASSRSVANDVLGANTDTTDAEVNLRAEIAIVASCVVRLGWVVALTSTGETHSLLVTLVGGCTFKVSTGALSTLAGVACCAEITVVARSVVGKGWECALACVRIAGAS